ncbi:hypothetical protein [Lactobacillus saniviri]|uniref:hypothetical protein n=1 Tax=Lacticaseibacillus saniviri TaxID=931533 RepID=UPI0006D0F6F6
MVKQHNLITKEQVSCNLRKHYIESNYHEKENLLRHWWLWLLLLLAVAGGTATYIATTHQAAPKRTTTKTVAKAIDWQQPSEKRLIQMPSKPQSSIF